MRKRTLVLISALAWVTTVAGCRPRSEPSLADRVSDAGALRIDWHQIFIRGQPAGYIQESESPREAGGYVTRTFMKLSISRGATPITMEALGEVEEDERGRVVRFSLEQKLSEKTTTTRGKVRGEVLEVVTEVEGEPPRRSERPYDPRAVGPRRTDEMARARLVREGDRLELIVFAPELQRCGTQTMEHRGEEEVSLPGGRRRLRRVETVLDILPTGPVTEWVDEGFRPVKISMPLLGMEFMALRSSREAILESQQGSPPEIFISSAVPVRRRVPRSATCVRYRMSWKAGAARGRDSLKLPVGAGQKFVQETTDDGAWTLEVRAIVPSPAATQATPPADLGAYLEPSAFVQSDDTKIRNVARQVAGAGTDRWKVARDLERWVYDNVEGKNLHTAFATAAEVIERREGDCTEHAVLLAALARATGIPSRVVAGLLYSNRSFVGHMWTEVFCGEWVPLDGTIGKGRVGPDHIALAVSSLSDTSMAELFLGLVPVIGSVDIEVLAIDPEGGGDRNSN